MDYFDYDLSMIYLINTPSICISNFYHKMKHTFEPNSSVLCMNLVYSKLSIVIYYICQLNIFLNNTRHPLAHVSTYKHLLIDFRIIFKEW